MADYNITGVKKSIKPMTIDLEIIKPPPTLTFLINPNTLDTKYTPRVSEQRTRWTDRKDSSYILQAHHDELDILSVAGRTAMFYTDQGITSANRVQSIAYENIQQILSIYRNNGMNFNKKPGRKASGVIDSVGRVIITYDQTIYKGSFDSFSLSEVADKPFNLEFTFDFRVTSTLDIGGLSNSILNDVLATTDIFETLTSSTASNLSSASGQLSAAAKQFKTIFQ